MKRIYLAGPMSGLPEFNYPAFHAEAARLRALGYHVENPAENPVDTSRLGAGFPDLIVGFNSITVLIEIKNPKTQYGRSGLNKRQKDWHASWNGGPLAIVDSPEAALRVLGVMAPESENRNQRELTSAL